MLSHLSWSTRHSGASVERLFISVEKAMSIYGASMRRRNCISMLYR
jgi:hypothetical protein